MDEETERLLQEVEKCPTQLNIHTMWQRLKVVGRTAPAKEWPSFFRAVCRLEDAADRAAQATSSGEAATSQVNGPLT